jgi:arginine/serine-rich splicing factor 16
MWKACRKQEKVIRGMMADARRRAERKKEYFASKFADPLQSLRITNTGIEVLSDSKMYHFFESGGNMMPYQGNSDLMIDKYDGRALLASLEPSSSGKRILSEEEADLESQLNYERYRSIIEAKKRGIDEMTLLRQIKEEMIDSKSAPTHKELERTKNHPLNQKEKSKAGKGIYGAVKFNYENPEESIPYEESDDEEDSVDAASVAASQISYIEETPEDQERMVNDMAQEYDIDDYCRLVRAENRDLAFEKKRLEEEAQRGGKKLSRRERRRLRDKDRRRFRKSPNGRSGVSGYSRRSSLTDNYRNKELRRSRSNSPRRKKTKRTVGTKEYITEFTLDNDDSESDSESDQSLQEIDQDESERIREATETNDDSTAILRRPGDRWHFARTIDEKYNQPRHKMKLREEESEKRPSISSGSSRTPTALKSTKKPTTPAIGSSSVTDPIQNLKKETPQERLKRKLRQQLNKKIKADRRETRRKEAQLAAERRRREEELDYNYGLRRSSPDYSRGGRQSSPSPSTENNNTNNNTNITKSSRRNLSSDSRSSSRSRSIHRDRGRSLQSSTRRNYHSRSRDHRNRYRIRHHSSSRSRSLSDSGIRRRSYSRSRSGDRYRQCSKSWSRSRSRSRGRKRNNRSRSRSRTRGIKRNNRSLSRSRSCENKRKRSLSVEKGDNKKQKPSILPSKQTKTKLDILMAQLDDLEKKHSQKGTSPNLQDYDLPTSFL